MTSVCAVQPSLPQVPGMILAAVFFFSPPFIPFALAQDSVEQPAATGPRAAPLPSSREKLTALNRTSDDLVQKLKNSKMDAANFRIRVVLYRESLRKLMLADQHATAAEQLPRPVLMELVRMAALLQAAANCETGRYLVCPADLMERLLLQQKTVADSGNTSTRSE